MAIKSHSHTIKRAVGYTSRTWIYLSLENPKQSPVQRLERQCQFSETFSALGKMKSLSAYKSVLYLDYFAMTLMQMTALTVTSVVPVPHNRTLNTVYYTLAAG